MDITSYGNKDDCPHFGLSTFRDLTSTFFSFSLIDMISDRRRPHYKMLRGGGEIFLIMIGIVID